MRILYWIFYALLFTGTAFSQQPETKGNVSVCVIVPEQSEYLNASQLSRLQGKLEQVVAANGVAALSNSNFVVYPIFEINESKLIEGGMKNIVKTSASLTLFIRRIASHTIVNSISINLQGSGLSKNESILNALLSLNTQDIALKSFLSEGRQRIVRYYKDNYQNIRVKANALSGQKRYEEALALLMTYPEELPEYPTLMNDALTLYIQYMNDHCSRLLSEAKGLTALNHYEGAISLLFQIDPSCKCAKDASILTSSIKKEIDSEVAYEKKREQQEIQSQANLEKKRIDAIKEIAKAYASNQPKIYYTQVVK